MLKLTQTVLDLIEIPVKGSADLIFVVSSIPLISNNNSDSPDSDLRSVNTRVSDRWRSTSGQTIRQQTDMLDKFICEWIRTMKFWVWETHCLCDITDILNCRLGVCVVFVLQHYFLFFRNSKSLSCQLMHQRHKAAQLIQWLVSCAGDHLLSTAHYTSF